MPTAVSGGADSLARNARVLYDPPLDREDDIYGGSRRRTFKAMLNENARLFPNGGRRSLQ